MKNLYQSKSKIIQYDGKIKKTLKNEEMLEVNIRLNHKKKENVITVPINAVVKRKSKNGKTDKYYIYLIDKNNKVTEKEVLVGMNNGEKIEISGENIKEGMEIVVNPNDKIKNNVIVKRAWKITKGKRTKEKRYREKWSWNNKAEKKWKIVF